MAIPPPFHDPFDDIPSIDELSCLFTDSPTLDQTLEFPLSVPDPQTVHGSNNDFEDSDPLSDPVIWALCQSTTDQVDGIIGNFEAGPSTFHGERSGHANNTGYDHVMPISSLPIPQNNCICCQKLRVITHMNGMNVKRLEIHGRLGIITHAVLEKYDMYNTCFKNPDLQMFDFHKESTRSVKRFLVQYFEVCRQEGYRMMQDPLSTFYEALCVGLNEDDKSDSFIQLSTDNPGDCPSNQQETWTRQESTSNNVAQKKIPLAMQRARTGKLELKDFIEYFEFPIEVAAKKLSICPTVMKKICRRSGVNRWPYRKINSLKSQISKRTEILETCDGEEKARAMADIETHQQELADIYSAFTKNSNKLKGQLGIQ